jgi:hypothetical protein
MIKFKVIEADSPAEIQRLVQNYLDSYKAVHLLSFCVTHVEGDEPAPWTYTQSLAYDDGVDDGSKATQVHPA